MLGFNVRRQCDVPDKGIAIPLGAGEALARLAAILGR